MDNIVVPVDGSKEANEAVKYAAQLAYDMDAKLTLLYIYDAPSAAFVGLNALDSESIEKLKENAARTSLSSAREVIKDANVETESQVAVGHPGEEIVNFTYNHPTDLIIMGRRGLSRIQNMLLGSVSEYVVRHAKCPVMIHH